MHRIFSTPPKVFLIAFLFVIQGTHALTLSKDTVYESSFLGRNDSTSLINTSTDTVRIDSILFLPPQRKYAELDFGYNNPYSKNGPVDGPILMANRRFTFSHPEDQVIPPKKKKLITGFIMEICIACPLGNFGSSSGKMDTLKTLLIFSLKGGEQDTLVVIGDVSTDPVSIFPRLPHLPLKPDAGEMGSLRLINCIGRETTENQRVNVPTITFPEKNVRP